ncbi:hypothetical protein BH23GEM1_BH23GEM1_10590 [soil metagenome]
MTGRILRWGITLAILALLILFARTVGWGAAWIAMRGASIPLLLLAFLANTASVLLRIVRWWLFLRPAGAPSLGLAMKADIAGVGLNNVLLANGGEVARVVFVSSASGVPSATVLATIALERMFDIVGFIVMVVAATLLFPMPPEMEGYRIPAIALLAVVLGGLGFLIYRTRHLTPITLAERPVEVSPPVGIVAKVGSFLKWFVASMGALANGPRFVGAMALSLLAWVFQIITFALCAKAAGIDVPLAASLAGLLAVNLGLVLRATPGNVGFFQFAYALTVEQFGVPRDPAIAVSLLIQTLQVVPVTIIGVALAPEFVFKKRGKAATP